MSRIVKSVIAAIAVVVLLAGCATHVHVVGNGPQTGEEITERQWYVLWGLVEMNTVDTNHIAADAEDYQIATEATFIDMLINVFAGVASIHARSVVVTR